MARNFLLKSTDCHRPNFKGLGGRFLLVTNEQTGILVNHCLSKVIFLTRKLTTAPGVAAKISFDEKRLLKKPQLAFTRSVVVAKNAEDSSLNEGFCFAYGNDYFKSGNSLLLSFEFQLNANRLAL